MAINHEALKKTRAGSRGGSGWKPKPGANRIFVLPPGSQYIDNPALLTDLSIHYRMHYFRIAGRPTEVSRCLEELRQRCPACETWRILRKSTDPAQAEAVKKIGPADTYLFNILDLGNLQAGIQQWSANFTCWDKIMDIAGNAAWGDVCDPASGVCFVVTLVPENQSRSSYNQYSVMPEPQRLEVLTTLNTYFPEWRAQLDRLSDAMVEAKEADDVRALVAECGFGAATGTVPPAHPAPQLAPSPVAMPAPAVAPAYIPPAGAAPVPPAAVPAPAPMAAAPAPVSMGMPAPAAAAPVAVGTAVSTAPPPAPAVHYDPGPGYVEKVPAELRPPGAPRCFSDFNAALHQCRPCPVQVPCQLKTLGLAG